MNEAQTRFNKNAPKLRDAGWGIVPTSNPSLPLSTPSNPRLTACKRTSTRCLRSAMP